MTTLTTLAQATSVDAINLSDHVNNLIPELILLIGGTICLITGLGRESGTRKFTAVIAAISLILAIAFIPEFSKLKAGLYEITDLRSFIKLAACGIGFLLILVSASVPDLLPQTQKAEEAKKFEPGNIYRGEYYAFFLFSIVGLMLTAGANDLVWLFLALELTSLPTYVMVATAKQNINAQEAAVKYFFLGALSSAIFLYGFALIYGATGYTDLAEIKNVIEAQYVANSGLSGMLLIGLIFSILGFCFKIAAFPMHYYAADVYQGASSAVTAFLAFVPKTAGFVALILILSTVGWNYGPDQNHLPQVIEMLLWVIAVITMFLGNVLGMIQTSVKRALAYSSIAHSGYIVVGLLAGAPAIAATAIAKYDGDTTLGLAIGDGIAAVMFYLVAYGLATVGSFAVLAALRKPNGEEIDSYADIAGLIKQHKVLASILALSVFSLLGMPPLIGFLGKIYIFGSAYKAGYVWLVIIAVVNSAISGAYYLRIANAAFFGKPAEGITYTKTPGRIAGALIGGVACLVLGLAGGFLVDTAGRAADQLPTEIKINDEQTAAYAPSLMTDTKGFSEIVTD
ncbi:NADH-quinone oxidoreductase subunit N [Poriferisphaera corsica]|nr:NADH-quinone oxidoreductase subunit N [Poriferisphaera corsica]